MSTVRLIASLVRIGQFLLIRLEQSKGRQNSAVLNENSLACIGHKIHLAVGAKLTDNVGIIQNSALCINSIKRNSWTMSDRNIHEQFQAQESVKSSSDRAFGFVFAGVFAIIGLAPLIFGNVALSWPLVVSAVFLALSLIRPITLAPLNRLWTKFGLLLHRITSPVIMALLFFLVVTPTGLCMRALGKRPLNIEIDHETASYWLERQPPGPAPESMKQQF